MGTKPIMAAISFGAQEQIGSHGAANGSRIQVSVQRELSSLNGQGQASKLSKLHIARQDLAFLLALLFLFVACPQRVVAQADPGPLQAPSVAPYQEQTPEEFAFVAYPAEYRSSGVMTFIVNQDGVVYQKDLGKKTEALGKSMLEYNPDSSWHKAEEEPTQTTSEPKA